MFTSGAGGQNIHKYYEEGPCEFPNIHENHFQLTDKQTINELETLHQNSVQMGVPIQQLGGTAEEQMQYRERQAKLLSVFNQINETPNNSNQYSTPYTNYEYYNMSDVQYDDKATLTEAFEYLKTLRVSSEANDLQGKVQSMSIESKPIYRKRDRAEEESQPAVRLTKQMQLLSFQDQE